MISGHSQHFRKTRQRTRFTPHIDEFVKRCALHAHTSKVRHRSLICAQMELTVLKNHRALIQRSLRFGSPNFPSTIRVLSMRSCSDRVHRHRRDRHVPRLCQSRRTPQCAWRNVRWRWAFMLVAASWIHGQGKSHVDPRTASKF